MAVMRGSDADLNHRRCKISWTEGRKLFWFRSTRSLVFILLQLRDMLCGCLKSNLTQALSNACLLLLEELEKEI
jgi:hypothetical protein